MSTAVHTRTRDPQAILNALAHRVPHLVTTAELTLWEREVALLLRDNSVMTRDTAERLLGQVIAYTITAMERKGVDMGVGYTVDVAVHALILDTPLYFALCDEYNGGEYKHHAPLITRRRDGTVLRTAQILRDNGFAVDAELWSMDAAECSPCDNQVPDSH
ncbi:hypothetical protein OYE22_11330 [Streptomyces sp. 71268]|uniref:hypothetical protein n=1 Tax=Streptomyces sp. 71268 TaxID=3002640 RepID=UPI0023F63D12|nr:hypothetical protein [Streptomyces sp. 71268]WEV25728.1 hypothetical protein OYE22_11330 [Streptomyces sp. 71268]